jgi:hypothetical protein
MRRVAWCVKIGSDSGLFAAWLEEHAARELYPGPTTRLTAEPPDGAVLRIEPGG